MDRKLAPKGLREINNNERFRKIMNDILNESQSFHSGSEFNKNNLTNTLTEDNFGMEFQNFVDDWSRNNIKKQNKDNNE